MKRPLAKLSMLFGVCAAVAAVALWAFGAGWLVVAACAAIAVVLFWASRGDLDSARGNQPVAVIIDPLTGVPDFDGYRPRESELPQDQPAAELIQHEVAGESMDEILARVVAAHQEAAEKKGE